MERRGFFKTLVGGLVGMVAAKFLPKLAAQPRVLGWVKDLRDDWIPVREVWRNGRVEYWCGNILLSEKPNPYWHGKPPYVEFKWPNSPSWIVEYKKELDAELNRQLGASIWQDGRPS